MRTVWGVVLAVGCVFGCGLRGWAQSAANTPDPAVRNWHAMWVTHPTAPLREPLVLHFRRELSLASAPASYIVRVSADNRFVLYVNGRRAGDGPARGDLTHWRYEKFDIAPYLKAGENRIAATVWNFGVYAPVAQMSDRTAFLLESEATGTEGISTPKGWMVEVEPGRQAIPRPHKAPFDYMAQGPGEKLDAAKYDWNWDGDHASGSAWVPVASAIRESIFAVNKAHSAQVTGDNPWGLVPDRLPHMAYTETAAGTVVRVEGASAAQFADFPASAVTVPAGTHLHILLDRKTLTTAYPELTVSGGKGARIWLTYCEALYDKNGHKGDRNAIAGRTAEGLSDLFLPDGSAHRTFESLWWRTWRYLDLDITTGSEPLTLEGMKAQFTAYPFVERATFETNNPALKKIWEISWRTARLDAHETYMDTPYWEQLQYIGDTRIQALISYAVTGDDRLARQAIEAFNDSRIPEGLTRSRYPSSLPQTIPTFSLLWIGMLHDWWMDRPAPAPVRESVQGERAVLAWFAQHERPDGLLEKLPWWSFIDWVVKGELPTYDAQGESCATTLEYLGALKDAADIEQALGDPVLAERDRKRAEHVRQGIYSQCWSAERGLIADNPAEKNFSQQANVLAVLYDVVPKADQRSVMEKMLAIEPGEVPANGVLSASYYFRFYLARALDHAGMADDYLASLDPWRKLLPLHFSTWPETPGVTRSDSHAWSAHPIYDLLTLVAGIEPASPGFKTVRIAPHLGNLPALKASFPHPEGMIEVSYQRAGSGLKATITLPGSLSGEFVWNGQTKPLHPGANSIQMQ